MPATYRVLSPDDYSDSFNENDAFALDVLVGLSDPRKWLPSKYLYDDKGSQFFLDITGLDEYYPTGCEREILRDKGGEIAGLLKGCEFNLVELGAGFGRKTMFLLDEFTKSGCDFRYVPIDISESAMSGLIEKVGEDQPQIEVNGLVSDYFAGLKWLNNRHTRRNLVIFLGSSIGNFTAGEARFFLKNVWNCLNNDDLVLIGFDLKKDIEVLLRAYNDSEGVTAEFNLNLLRRINSKLGGEFDTSKFRHFGTYDVFSGGMESYLVSLEEQEVHVADIGRSFLFRPWEPIHIEYSYKYLVSDIETLASDTGFEVQEHLYDSRRWFVDSIWKVAKPGLNS